MKLPPSAPPAQVASTTGCTKHVSVAARSEEAVLSVIDANKAAFAELSRELGGTMQLVGYFRDVNPGVHFDLEVGRRMAEYGLCIDCDFYNC